MKGHAGERADAVQAQGNLHRGGEKKKNDNGEVMERRGMRDRVQNIKIVA